MNATHMNATQDLQGRIDKLLARAERMGRQGDMPGRTYDSRAWFLSEELRLRTEAARLVHQARQGG